MCACVYLCACVYFVSGELRTANCISESYVPKVLRHVYASINYFTETTVTVPDNPIICFCYIIFTTLNIQ